MRLQQRAALRRERHNGVRHAHGERPALPLEAKFPGHERVGVRPEHHAHGQPQPRERADRRKLLARADQNVDSIAHQIPPQQPSALWQRMTQRTAHRVLAFRRDARIEPTRLRRVRAIAQKRDRVPRAERVCRDGRGAPHAARLKRV